eukprot:TRINITY_DN1238_c0_g1_i1.p1 TRINITY_DN1238_c0_g1~~TRINITY_DN1238_c0_g1_i1.p1  ORF type:complete len:483 (+),score=214.57 TRINITY_DN1238_c0_g1_i1:101-1450(+)
MPPKKDEAAAQDGEGKEEELLDFDDDEGAGGEGTQAARAVDGGHSTIQIAGFRDFLLKPELNRAIIDNGFEHPSEVQHQCIPAAILGQDILAQAKSGMGKTAVFVLSLLHQVENTETKGVQVICLVHTRELAFQIKKEFIRFAKYLSFVKVAVFFGGVPIEKDRATLQSGGDDCPNVVVGTPGRVLALIKEGALKTDKVKYFVMDEADKLLEQLDMRQDAQNIFIKCPSHKQVMMFSATLPKDVRVVAKKFMKDPLEIYVDSQAKLTLHGLQQYFVALEERQKNRKLVDLLDSLEFNQVIIFVRSTPRCNALNLMLKECGFPSVCINSRMPQDERIATYQAFKEFKSRICVATNLFGRGIDIERVNIVIQYDMAASADEYLHRVGRAGRFGTKGLAVCFLTDDTDKGVNPATQQPFPPDRSVMTAVQERFEVEVKPLPDRISVDSYMQQ